MRKSCYPVLSFVIGFCCATSASLVPQGALAAQKAPGGNKGDSDVVAEVIFDSGLKGGWQDWGWTKRALDGGKPARLHFSKYGGWILAHKDLNGRYAALSFRIRAPAKFGDFLEVRLASATDDSLPRIKVGADHRGPSEGGWNSVRLSMTELNPSATGFDRVIFRAFRSVEEDEVEIDKIVIYGGDVEPEALPDVAAFQSHDAHLKVDCRAPSHAISPLIYGMAFNPQHAGGDSFQWDLGATARRWGGNNSSRYNWKIGNAWNTANDWFFMNVNYTNDRSYSWTTFFDENRSHHVKTALSIPMLGWVAKDTEAYSFPVSVFGPQQYSNNDVGNGMKQGGGKMTGADPHRTSIEAPPAFMGEWVRAIRKYDNQTHTRNVDQYILDNEPMLWNSTHRDVHPSATTYDELLKKTIDYGAEVRKADPQGVIAGPALWGWPAYFYSALDAEVGFSVKPDRRMHGDAPFLNWWLMKLRDHAQKTGQRILDVVDVHFYPQADGTYGHGEKTDPAGADLRIRATRALWDPTYKDESWIAEKIRLIPRLKEIIADNYPGLKVSIGEYNFGGERHISGALAQAEALGRFGQQDVWSAYYWTYPPANSSVFHAFRAFRNYDGQGAHFLNNAVVTTSDAKTSLFASKGDTDDSMVLIALNLDQKQVADVTIDMPGCAAYTVSRAFVYNSGASALRPLEGSIAIDNHMLRQKLLPYSITVFELKRKH